MNLTELNIKGILYEWKDNRVTKVTVIYKYKDTILRKVTTLASSYITNTEALVIAYQDLNKRVDI